MKHELFFKSFWLLSVGGMWYLGTEFNQLWHADLYMPLHWILAGSLVLIGVFAAGHWVDLSQAEPSLLASINGNYVRTFYWRDWMFDDGRSMHQNIAWDDFLTIVVAATAAFLVGHFAGPLRDGVDYSWFFWVALALAGYLPTWLRRRDIDRWREYINAKQVEQELPKPHLPPEPPGGASKTKISPEKTLSRDTNNGKVVPLRPEDGDSSELTA